jgi:nucleoside-diphosphate-sugar epimerase
MGRHYLVTGGTGFIGSALVKSLLQAGHRVRVLDSGFRGVPGRLADVAGGLELVNADIRNADAVRSAASGVDGVIHLAYVNGTRYFYEQPELVLDVGIRGMLNVLDACRQAGVKDLVVASSSEVYQTPPVTPTDETVPLSIPDVLNPRYSYGGGKLAVELMAINYGRTGFDRVVIFRPHNVYGPDMGWEHVIPEFSCRAADAIEQSPAGPVPFSIQGDGKQTRAFVHIDDFTDGLMRVIEKGKHLNIYHIGNPEEVSIGQLAKSVVRCLGREADLKEGPAAAGGTPRRSPDIRKLMGLGFAPRISLSAGLPPVVAWYAKNRHLRPQQKSSGVSS